MSRADREKRRLAAVRVRRSLPPHVRAELRAREPEPTQLVPLQDPAVWSVDDADEHETFPVPMFDGG